MRSQKIVATLAVAILATSVSGVGRCEPPTKRPNIVFILTDYQDMLLKSIDHMPLTQKYLVKGGTTFEKHFCTGNLGS
jgi:hypothetical protein